MSEENIELVRRAFVAYQRGDTSWIFKYAVPDLITHRAHPVPDAGTYHGPRGFLQMIADWLEGFDEFNASAEEFIDAGDQVLVRVRQRATGARSGTPIEADFWFVFTIRGRKLVRLDMFAEKAQALEAAGLGE